MDIEDLDEANEIITMFGDDGEEIEFTVINAMEYDGTNYLLVIETEFSEDDDTEALLLKEVSENGKDFFYATVEEDEEFEKMVEIFSADNDNYELEL
jgi:uncharacterized protein YrzB (UPF0473 family)